MGNSEEMRRRLEERQARYREEREEEEKNDPLGVFVREFNSSTRRVLEDALKKQNSNSIPAAFDKGQYPLIGITLDDQFQERKADLEKLIRDWILKSPKSSFTREDMPSLALSDGVELLSGKKLLVQPSFREHPAPKKRHFIDVKHTVPSEVHLIQASIAGQELYFLYGEIPHFFGHMPPILLPEVRNIQLPAQSDSAPRGHREYALEEPVSFQPLSDMESDDGTWGEGYLKALKEMIFRALSKYDDDPQDCSFGWNAWGQLLLRQEKQEEGEGNKKTYRYLVVNG